MDETQLADHHTEAADSLVQTERLDRASELISSATRWSAAASMVPVPYVDLLALGTVQGKLIYNICELYEQPYTKELVNGTVSVLLGTLLPVSATRVAIGSFAKLIPGYGSAVGTLSLAVFGSAATYALGRVFVRHFENGGSLINFSVDSIKEDLKREFVKATAKLKS